MTNQPNSNSLYAVANSTASSAPFIEVFSTRDPTANDSLYPVQKRWFNTVSNNEWVLVGFTASNGVISANWQNITTGGGSGINTLKGNSGLAVGPTGNNINVVGDGTSITVAGNPGTHTLTISAVNGGVVLETLTTQDLAVVHPSAGNINLNGSGSLTTTGSGSTATVNLTGLTNHAVLVGAGTTTITKVGPNAASGIPLISQGVGADPIFGTAVVAGGGTGDTSFTPYSVITGGTTSTGPLQNVSGLGALGEVLTSQGPGTLPIWATGGAPGATPTGFNVYLNTGVNNVTGDGTNYQVIFDAVSFDNASAYSTITGRYTIPTTGNWLISTEIDLVLSSNGGDGQLVSLIINGTITNRLAETGTAPTGNVIAISGSGNAIVVYLTAGTTVAIGVTAVGGTKTCGIRGIDGPTALCWFSGSLQVASGPTEISWQDKATNFSAVANNGYFCTATLTATLPASPTQGQEVDIAMDSAGVVTVLAAAGQTIRIASLVSTIAGTASGTSIGASVQLIYRSANTEWFSIATQGSWVLA